MDPQSPRTEWQLLIDLMREPLPPDSSLLSSLSLPFCHYAMRIPANPGTGVLHQIYHRLYDNASKSVQSWNEGCPLEHRAVDNNSGEAPISYNLAMTTHTMAICPRRKESATLPTTSGVGSAAVNGTILGGTLMVKEMSEWEAFRQNHVVIDDVLAEIGIPYLSNPGDALSTRT